MHVEEPTQAASQPSLVSPRTPDTPDMALDVFLHIVEPYPPQVLQTPEALLQPSGATFFRRPIASVVAGQAEEVQVVTREVPGDGVARSPIISDHHSMRKQTDTLRDEHVWENLHVSGMAAAEG